MWIDARRGPYVLILLILTCSCPMAWAQKRAPDSSNKQAPAKGDDATDATDDSTDEPAEKPEKPADPLNAISQQFIDADYDAVLETAKKLKAPGTKLTAEQCARIAQLEGEALLCRGKYADAEKTLRTSVGDSDAARRASEIVRILKPAIPSGELDGQPLSNPEVLAAAMAKAGEPLANSAGKSLEEIQSSLDRNKTIAALERGGTDLKKLKVPWQKPRDKFVADLTRLETLQPERATELAGELGTTECEHFDSVSRSIRRDVERRNPLDGRIKYWMDSDRITTTSWKEIQAKVKECVPSVIGLRNAAHLLKKSKDFPTQFGGSPAETTQDSELLDQQATEVATLLDEIINSPRPKIEQFDDWRQRWADIGRGAGNDGGDDQDREGEGDRDRGVEKKKPKDE